MDFIDPTDPQVSILVIDDGRPNRDIICSVLKQNFPLAAVYAPENLFQQGAEGIFTMGKYTHILLDDCLASWGEHPVFGEWGENMIPFIKKHCPSAVIIAISRNATENERMIKRGADIGFPKENFIRTELVRNLPLPIIYE